LVGNALESLARGLTSRRNLAKLVSFPF